MKAKCPHCESGCDKCTNGYMEASFKSGTFWTRHCNTCKEDNGGCICSGEPSHKPGDCVFCKSTDMIWLKVGDTEKMGLTKL